MAERTASHEIRTFDFKDFVPEKISHLSRWKPMQLEDKRWVFDHDTNTPDYHELEFEIRVWRYSHAMPEDRKIIGNDSVEALKFDSRVNLFNVKTFSVENDSVKFFDKNGNYIQIRNDGFMFGEGVDVWLL